MKNSQRLLCHVPLLVKILLVTGLVLQISWHQYRPNPSIKIDTLYSPPSIEVLQMASFGDPIVAAKLYMLWLRTFETQAGQFLPYNQLDYVALRQWLERILQLDPRSQYPLLAASHLYSNVNNPIKQRQILDFIYTQFLIDPNRRWSWLAHAVVLARHRLKDLPLALKYAQAISDHATSDMPRWAQEMQIFILEDMGELERAQLIIGGILLSGQLTDPKEIEFLNDKLTDLEGKTQKTTMDSVE